MMDHAHDLASVRDATDRLLTAVGKLDNAFVTESSRLPGWSRGHVLAHLRHIAEQTFAPGVEYPERTVDEKLRAWCEDGEVDHVTLRRHLVDFGHLRRSDGVYTRPADSARTGTA